ncbi:MAG: beta-ketoacyl-ACP synthase II [Anaerolineae bacterium]
MMDVVQGPDRRAGRRRVVVTGLGAITPVGHTAGETWEAFVQGRSGVAEVTLFDARAFPTRLAAEVKDFRPEAHIAAKDARRMARCSQLAIVAGRQAVADAGIDVAHEDRERIGVVLGVAFGGIDILMEPIHRFMSEGTIRVTPHVPLETLINMPAFHIGLEHGFQGPLSTLGTACAAGTQAIGEGLEWIRRGACDVVLAGGAEAQITPLFYIGFTSMKVLSTYAGDPTKASRPFDLNRDGFVIGEGAVILVLEELEHALRRGARIYAEVLGQAATADAFHIAAPDPSGAGPARTMRLALADAGVAAEQVDYINAHGSATQPNDAAETAAIKQVFGAHAYRLAISSTKSLVGHLFGAAGAVEALATVMAIHTDTIHPTINYETPDPACDLDYTPNVARRRRVNVALSNSFGLGGQNACVVFGKWSNHTKA